MNKIFLLTVICFPLNILSNEISREEILAKIRAEYQNALSSQNLGNARYVKVNEKFNTTLFNAIKDLAEKMEIKTKFEITIFKGNKATKKVQKFLGIDFRYNAFAMGLMERSMSINIGKKLFSILTYEELMAVIAHELAHIKFKHVRNQVINNLALMFSISGFNYMLTEMGVLNKSRANSLITNIFIKLMQMRKSRQYEFEADSEASKFVKNKQDLVNAVIKIQKALTDSFNKSKLAKLSNIFSTHPSLEDRAKNINSQIVA